MWVASSSFKRVFSSCVSLRVEVYFDVVVKGCAISAVKVCSVIEWSIEGVVLSLDWLEDIVLLVFWRLFCMFVRMFWLDNSCS